MSARVALVTGASRGIGAHLSRALLDADWHVVGLSRSGGTPDGVEGRSFGSIACDVTDEGAVNAAVAEVMERQGRIDLLVNNAGLVEPEQPLWEADADRWWQVMVTNVRGPFLLTRAVVPHMIAKGGGRVINLNSGSGTRESDVLTAYHASKSALARLTGGVALALADGELDGFSGRFVRAGTDDLDELRRRSRAGLAEGERMLRLRPWGDDDPVA